MVGSDSGSLQCEQNRIIPGYMKHEYRNPPLSHSLGLENKGHIFTDQFQVRLLKKLDKQEF